MNKYFWQLACWLKWGIISWVNQISLISCSYGHEMKISHSKRGGGGGLPITLIFTSNDVKNMLHNQIPAWVLLLQQSNEVKSRFQLHPQLHWCPTQTPRRRISSHPPQDADCSRTTAFWKSSWSRKKMLILCPRSFTMWICSGLVTSQFLNRDWSSRCGSGQCDCKFSCWSWSEGKVMHVRT